RLLDCPRREHDLRAEHHLHASRLHTELAGSGAEIQMPLSRQRFPQGWDQLRRTSAAAARTLQAFPCRRRSVTGGQEQEIPESTGAVDGAGGISEVITGAASL